MVDDKYKMFRNFMFNELGITKEDIRDWIQEAVKEEAHRLIMNTYNNFDVGTELRRQLTDRYNPLRQDIISDCSKKLLETITLTINKKED